MAVACLFIGPATFIHTPPLTIPLIYAMCATAGLGVGLVGISTFSRLYLAVLGLGYKDDIHTFLLVSGEKLKRLCTKNVAIQILQSTNYEQ